MKRLIPIIFSALCAFASPVFADEATDNACISLLSSVDLSGLSNDDVADILLSAADLNCEPVHILMTFSTRPLQGDAVEVAEQLNDMVAYECSRIAGEKQYQAEGASHAFFPKYIIAVERAMRCSTTMAALSDSAEPQ